MSPGPWLIPFAAKGGWESAGEPSILCGTWVLRCLELRQSHPGLLLVLPLLVGVAGLADVIVIGLEEQNLADAFVGVDLGREGRRIADLEGHVAFPLGLEWRDVGDDAAARVRGLSKADRENVSRDAEIFYRSRQRKAVWRDDAHIPVEL